MAVRSLPIVSAPPLPRAWLRHTLRPLRALVGVLLLAWSWGSTVAIISWLLAPLLPGASLTAAVPDRVLLGLGLALIVSVAEWATADAHPRLYWAVLLALDASFTALQTYWWVATLVQGHGWPMAGWAQAMAVLGAGALGVGVARWGELLLLGQRGEATHDSTSA